MKRRLNASDEAALRRLRDRLALTLDFIESVQEFPSGAAVRKLVQESADQSDLRGLRLLAREIEMSPIGLAPHERDGLEALLQERLGVDIEAEREAISANASVAIRRGTIASEKERRRLEDYAEQLEARDPTSPEAAAIRGLLRKS